MSSTLTIRRRIPVTEQTSALLGDVEQRAAPTTFSQVRSTAQALTLKTADDQDGAPGFDTNEAMPIGGAPEFFHVWGLVADGDDADAVRAGLIDRNAVISEVVFGRESDAAAPVTQADNSKNATLGDAELEKEYVADLSELSEDEQKSISPRLPISPMPLINTSQHWSGGSFGSARDAMRLIDADWAADGPGTPKTGRDGAGVNVVIVDHGLNRKYLQAWHPGLIWGGGFVQRLSDRPDPGDFVDTMKRAPDGHGNMIARSVLRLAPKARIWDAPLLPDRVTDFKAFTDDVELLYEGIEAGRRASEFRDEPWVIVNAWAAANTIQDHAAFLSPSQRYAIGPNNIANLRVQLMSHEFDIVFAAGNFGEFAPTPFTGLYDRGPEKSISGCNALAGVLTVAAVNTTGDWIGTSSQGDAPGALKYGDAGATKPDLAAPSWFCENDDRSAVSSGTSTSCAVAAGVVAALRSEGSNERNLSTADLFALLRKKAVRSNGSWNNRTGYGRIRMI